MIAFTTEIMNTNKKYNNPSSNSQSAQNVTWSTKCSRNQTESYSTSKIYSSPSQTFSWVSKVSTRTRILGIGLRLFVGLRVRLLFLCLISPRIISLAQLNFIGTINSHLLRILRQDTSIFQRDYPISSNYTDNLKLNLIRFLSSKSKCKRIKDQHKVLVICSKMST